MTNAYNEEHDSRYCKEGFGGERFRVNLKVKAKEATIKKVEKIKEKAKPYPW